MAGAALVAGAGAAVSAAAGHAPDEDAYRGYVATHLGGNHRSDLPQRGAQDRAWAAAHPDQVLALGRQACAWLGTQPLAPEREPSGRQSGAHTASTLLTRYAAAPPSALGVQLSEDGRGTLAAGAWAHLCRDERARRTATLPGAD